MSNLTQGLTLETLPNAFTHLAMEVSEIKRLLLEKSNEQPTTDPDELLTVRGAAEFLTLSVPTIYALISKGELPVIKRGKRCYFLKIDLMAWLKQGRRKTNTEIAIEVKAYQKRKGASHE